MRGSRFVFAALLFLTFLTPLRGRAQLPLQPGAGSWEEPDHSPAALPEGASVLHRDPSSGAPKLVLAKAPPPPEATTPEEAAWSHLRRVAPIYGLDGALELLSIRAVHQQRIGPVIVAFEAKVAGIPLFLHELAIAMTQDLALLGISGSLSPHLGAAAAAPLPFPLGMERAIAVAWGHGGGSPHSPVLVEAEMDAAGFSRFQAEGADGIRAAQVLFDRGDTLRAAYYVELLRGLESRSFVVDAEDGAILFVNELAHRFTYRVWADVDGLPHPSPLGRAGFPALSSSEPLTPVDSRLVELLHGPISTQDPWLPPEALEASGNNVEVFADIRAATRPTATDTAVFDHPFAMDEDPVGNHEQLRASLTQLFYTINWVHDWLYDAGFTEEWRNAQESNFGRGGAEGDRLVANNFSRDIPNNAYIIVPADGEAPTMKIGIYRGERDLAQDATVTVHEYGHLLSLRLIGNGSGLRLIQARSMGEGWSDFLSLLLLAKEEDALVEGNELYQGRYPIGLWGTMRRIFGYRRYPYSSSLDANPLTLGHITQAHSLPSSPPRSPNGNSNAQIHNAGEVWATMLWQLYTSILNDPRHGFDEARELMLHLLLAAMKLTPPNPTYIEGRDALVLAAAGFYDELPEQVMQAFALRGAGLGARAPHPLAWGNRPAAQSFHFASGLHLREFSVEESIEERCDLDGVVDAGEVGIFRLSLANGDLEAARDVSLTLSSSTPEVHFLGETSFHFDAVDPLQTIELEVEFGLDELSEPLSLSFDVSLAAPGRPTEASTVEGMANYDGCIPDRLGNPRRPCLIEVDARSCVNRPPILVTDVPAHMVGGTEVEVSAASSYDPDGDPIEFQWLLSFPEIDGVPYAAPAEIRDPTEATTTFYAPKVMDETLAVITLVGSDPQGRSRADFEVVVHPHPPTAKALAEPSVLRPGEEGLLVGEGANPRRDELQFQWLQTEGPAVALESPKEPSTTFIAPEVEADTTLQFALITSNGALESEPAYVEVLVEAALPISAAPGRLIFDRLDEPRKSVSAAKGGCTAGGGGAPAGVLALAWAAGAIRRRNRSRQPRSQ